jgi:hypothetical protein
VRRRARPEAACGKSSRQFLSGNRHSRYNKSRGRSATHRGAFPRGRDHKKWRKSESGSTDRQPLDFPQNGQRKSLEILGKIWKSKDFPWNFLGKVWKPWE